VQLITEYVAGDSRPILLQTLAHFCKQLFCSGWSIASFAGIVNSSLLQYE